MNTGVGLCNSARSFLLHSVAALVLLTGVHPYASEQGDTLDSGRGYSWSRITAEAPWSGRVAGSVVSFSDAIWLLAGYGYAGLMNDVWLSEDGHEWVQVTNSAPWSPRVAKVFVFQDWLWVLDAVYLEKPNDVWSSSDGVTWTRIEPDPPWTQREAYGTVVFNDMIWVLGGTAYYASTGAS